jgi:hypothetical protein
MTSGQGVLHLHPLPEVPSRSALYLQVSSDGCPTGTTPGTGCPSPTPRVGNFRQKNNSAEDGIVGTNGYF